MFEEESDDYPPYEIQMPGNVLNYQKNNRYLDFILFAYFDIITNFKVKIN